MNYTGSQRGDEPALMWLPVARLRDGLISMILLVGIISLHAGVAVAADPPRVAGAPSPGLDTRPVNATCVAPQRPSGEVPDTVEVDIVRVFANLEFEAPIDMVQAPGDDSKWYLATRAGRVWVFENRDDVEERTMGLDLRERIRFTRESASQQWGIMSLMFHPQFPDRPYLYVAYNARQDRQSPVISIVARFETMDGGNTFAADSEVVVWSQVQEETRFHHIGQIAFGPDGYLYIGLGDDNGQRGQDISDARGAILRIDVDNEEPFGIPADNPLVGMANVREEIYAWGLRNPWRFSFDTETGDLWTGDVGRDSWEEVNLVVKGGNYGWKILEGNECVEPGCDPSGLIPPVIAYDHREGAAVIGGFVYRGRAMPGLVGAYVFGDTSANHIWALFFDADGNPERRRIGRSSGNKPHVFMQGNDGELYIMRVRPDPQGPRKLVPKGANATEGPEFPTLLSQTGCVDPAAPQTPAAGTIPYRVNSPQWSDGAVVQRWMAIPENTQIEAQGNGGFVFPAGTVLAESFSFDGMPVETRLLIRHNDGGWAGYSYEWLEDGSDAVLLEEGKTIELPNGQMWTFPSRTECLMCHTQTAGYALGTELAQLNGEFEYPSTGRTANQLLTLQHIGVLTDPQERPLDQLPALAAASDDTQPVAWRSRSYLHANCSGCHQPEGPTPSLMDMRFFTRIESMNVCNVPPQFGNLGLENPLLIAPGSPDDSMLYHRMNRRGPRQMPPLATLLVDAVAVDVIRNWILSDDVCPPAGSTNP